MSTTAARCRSQPLALFWSWYNIVLLSVACIVCIEQPRLQRKAERLRGARPVTLTIGTQTHVYETADISLGGMRILGLVRAEPGTVVGVQLGTTRFDGRIVRRSDRDFAIEIERSSGARAAMVQQVYSGGFESAIGRIRPTAVARKVLARIFQ